MTKTLIIKALARSTRDGETEELHFGPGVNILVGPPNSGKTQWLRMLDYVMGDGKAFTRKFPQALHKYEVIRAVVDIDGKDHVIERQWKVKSTKVIFDGQELSTEDFSAHLLTLLEMPILHFPTGNPFAKRAWPELSWRTLYRHVYRRNDSWDDLAVKQPPEQQLAALLLFLGLAERLFSNEYAELVQKRKAVYAQEETRERFLTMLNRVTRELLDVSEVGVAITPDSLNAARGRLEEEAAALRRRREHVLQEAQTMAIRETATTELTVMALREEWAALHVRVDELRPQLEQARARAAELDGYVKALDDETARLARTQDAARIFAGLKVTHCPACRQSVDPARAASGECYICGQDVPEPQASGAADERLAFEREQLRVERAEAQTLLDRTQHEVTLLLGEFREANGRMRQLDAELAPLRSAIAAVLPPELSVLDTEGGRLQERIRQLDRVREVLDLRDEMNDELARLELAVDELKLQVNALKLGLKQELRRMGDIFQDAMNDYLNEIKRLNPRSWTQNDVTVRISPDVFKIRVGGGDWEEELGSTLTFYFLFAYNFALLKMTPRAGMHYPGLTILDLRGGLADGVQIRDAENFVLEPFIHLTGQPGYERTQVIATGNAFKNLSGARKIEFSRVWVASSNANEDDEQDEDL